MKFILGIVGVILIFLTRIHHIIINSEFTEAQAFIAYWPFWTIGAGAILMSILFDGKDKG